MDCRTQGVPDIINFTKHYLLSLSTITKHYHFLLSLSPQRLELAVHVVDLRLMAEPPFRIELRVEFVDGFVLLFDPGVVLQVVPALAIFRCAVLNPVDFLVAQDAADARVDAGGVEAMVRLIGTKLTESLGQPVIVENRPGGNAQIGISYVAKSPPDGYTLGLGFVTNLSLAPHVFKSMPYDSQKDLAPVALLGTNYLAVVARPDAPLASVADLARW